MFARNLMYLASAGASAASAYIATKGFIEGDCFLAIAGSLSSFYYTSNSISLSEINRKQRVLEDIDLELPHIRAELGRVKTGISEHRDNPTERKEFCIKRAGLIRRLRHFSRHLSS